MTDHQSRGHALLSPSSAHRWLNCPPSVRAAEQLDTTEQPSEFAEQGTVAHEIAEYKLRCTYGEQPDIPIGPTVQRWYDEEMDTHTTAYAQWVAEQHRHMGMDARLEVEQHVTLDGIVKEGFGTVDAIIHTPTHIHIIDFKYGKGVPVSPVENPQLMLYAYGAMKPTAKGDGATVGHVRQVSLSIYQPRINNITTWTTTADELLEWACDFVSPQAYLAYRGQGFRRAGDWCRWCPLAGTCTELTTHNLNAMRRDFGLTEPAANELSNQDMGDIIAAGPTIRHWLDAVTHEATMRAEFGQTIPGHKLVAGRTTRKITDPQAALQALAAAGVDPTTISETKLAGITTLEKTLGKQQLEDLLGDYITKPVGKPTLAPESDRRKAITIDTN